MAQPRHIAGSPRKRRGVPRNHGAQQPSAVPGRAQLAEGRCRGGGFRQETYLSAFANLHRYAGTAALSTWLTRIALNEALGRLRRRRSMVEFDDDRAEFDAGTNEAGARVIPFPLTQSTTPVSRTRSSAPI
jgi:hypothetical protein